MYFEAILKHSIIRALKREASHYTLPEPETSKKNIPAKLRKPLKQF